MAGHGRRRDRRRDADEDQERRGEEAAADAEHAGDESDREPDGQDDDDIDRHVCDRKVDLHGSVSVGSSRVGVTVAVRRTGSALCGAHSRASGNREMRVCRLGPRCEDERKDERRHSSGFAARNTRRAIFYCAGRRDCLGAVGFGADGALGGRRRRDAVPAARRDPHLDRRLGLRQRLPGLRGRHRRRQRLLVEAAGDLVAFLGGVTVAFAAGEREPLERFRQVGLDADAAGIEDRQIVLAVDDAVVGGLAEPARRGRIVGLAVDALGITAPRGCAWPWRGRLRRRPRRAGARCRGSSGPPCPFRRARRGGIAPAPDPCWRRARTRPLLRSDFAERRGLRPAAIAISNSAAASPLAAAARRPLPMPAGSRSAGVLRVRACGAAGIGAAGGVAAAAVGDRIEPVVSLVRRGGRRCGRRADPEHVRRNRDAGRQRDRLALLRGRGGDPRRLGRGRLVACRLRGVGSPVGVVPSQNRVVTKCTAPRTNE